MTKFYRMFIVAGLLFAGVTSTHATSAWDDENFSATVWFTSDYIFRGVSFSDEDPAVQASLDWGYNNFYAGLWGSNLELADEAGSGDGYSSVEYDFYVGYADRIGAIDYDAALVYYWFPNYRGKLEADVVEVQLTLAHTFENMALSPTFSLFGAWSPDATLEDGDSIYAKASLALVLSETWGLDFGIGTTDVDGDKSTPDGYGYAHYEVGLAGELKGFGLDFRFHDTNEQKSYVNYWGGDEDPLDSRFVFTLSRSF